MTTGPNMGGEIPDHAIQGLCEVFPGAVFNTTDIPVNNQQLENLKKAGMGIIQAVEPDGSCHLATYLVSETPQTRILSIIYDFEQKGLLGQGAQDLAIDDIMAGTFDRRYGRFYTRLQG